MILPMISNKEDILKYFLNTLRSKSNIYNNLKSLDLDLYYVMECDDGYFVGLCYIKNVIKINDQNNDLPLGYLHGTGYQHDNWEIKCVISCKQITSENFHDLILPHSIPETISNIIYSYVDFASKRPSEIYVDKNECMIQLALIDDN